MRFPYLLLPALLLSCRPAPPPLPALDLSTLHPEVRRVIDEARAAAAADPDNAAATVRLGMTLQSHEQLQSAIICYARAHAIDPKRFETLYYWGQALAANGDAAGASAKLREALAIRASSAAKLKLAEVVRDADPKESERLAREILAASPADATAHYLLGRATSGDTAIAAYRRAIELFPRYGAARFALASAYRQAGQDRLAAEALRDYERDKLVVPPVDDPEMAALKDLNVSAGGLLRRALRAEQAGQLSETLSLHLRAIDMEPDLADAWVNLISIHARLGRAAEVEQVYRKAIAIAPNRADAHYNYGVALVQANRLTDAAAAFQKTVALDPRHAQAHYNLGGIAASAGRMDAAAASFTHAVEADPAFARAHYELGRVLAVRGLRAKAIASLNRAADAERRSPTTVEFAAAIEQALADLGAKP